MAKRYRVCIHIRIGLPEGSQDVARDWCPGAVPELRSPAKVIANVPCHCGWLLFILATALDSSSFLMSWVTHLRTSESYENIATICVATPKSCQRPHSESSTRGPPPNPNGWPLIVSIARERKYIQPTALVNPETRHLLLVVIVEVS